MCSIYKKKRTINVFIADCICKKREVHEACKRGPLWEQHQIYFQAEKIHNGSKSEYICKQRKEYKKSLSQPKLIWYISYVLLHWYDCYFPQYHSNMKFINKRPDILQSDDMTPNPFTRIDIALGF